MTTATITKSATVQRVGDTDRFIATGRFESETITLTPHGDSGTYYAAAVRSAEAFADHHGIGTIELPATPMHTSKIAARSLRHNSMFQITPAGQYYRVAGTPHHITLDGITSVELDLIGADGALSDGIRFGLNEYVHGVVGAI